MKKEIGFVGLLKEPAVQVYLLGCLIGLGLIALVEMARGQSVLVLLVPVILVVGALGMFARFSTAPVMLLLLVAGGELYNRRMMGGQFNHEEQHFFRSPNQFGYEYNPVDWVLCLGMLTYFLCQFRLLALTGGVFPRDTRRRREPSANKPVPYRRRQRIVQKRAPHTITILEVVLALISLPIWTLVAVALWSQLLAPPNLFGLALWQCRLLFLLWILFALIVLAGSCLACWRWYTWSADEALLVLQDTYWRESRREQGRQYRWLAWARRRGKYRKGTP